MAGPSRGRVPQKTTSLSHPSKSCRIWHLSHGVGGSEQSHKSNLWEADALGFSPLNPTQWPHPNGTPQLEAGRPRPASPTVPTLTRHQGMEGLWVDPLERPSAGAVFGKSSGSPSRLPGCLGPAAHFLPGLPDHRVMGYQPSQTALEEHGQPWSRGSCLLQSRSSDLTPSRTRPPTRSPHNVSGLKHSMGTLLPWALPQLPELVLSACCSVPPYSALLTQQHLGLQSLPCSPVARGPAGSRAVASPTVPSTGRSGTELRTSYGKGGCCRGRHRANREGLKSDMVGKKHPHEMLTEATLSLAGGGGGCGGAGGGTTLTWLCHSELWASRAPQEEGTEVPLPPPAPVTPLSPFPLAKQDPSVSFTKFGKNSARSASQPTSHLISSHLIFV